MAIVIPFSDLSLRAYPDLSLRAVGVAISPHRIATGLTPLATTVGLSSRNDSRGGIVSLIMWTELYMDFKETPFLGTIVRRRSELLSRH